LKGTSSEIFLDEFVVVPPDPACEMIGAHAMEYLDYLVGVAAGRFSALEELPSHRPMLL
jgi:hypothetical protein